MENIHIIIDTSSSMSVLSKMSILNNVCLFIKGVSNNTEYQDMNFIFYTWGAEGIKEYAFQDDIDIVPSRKAEIKDFIDFIKSNDKEQLKILLLTDGYIDTSLYNVSYKLLSVSIDIINIGIDSDTKNLANKLKAQDFDAENIAYALSHICFQV